MKSHQQSPRYNSRRSSPRKSQHTGPFKSLRHMSSSMFNEERRTLRKTPTNRTVRPDSTTKEHTHRTKTKTRKGLSQILGWKHNQGTSDEPPLPPVPSFAADGPQGLAPQSRPRPSAGPDPFKQAEGGATMIPAGLARSRKTSAMAMALTAERHALSSSVQDDDAAAVNLLEALYPRR